MQFGREVSGGQFSLAIQREKRIDVGQRKEEGTDRVSVL